MIKTQFSKWCIFPLLAMLPGSGRAFQFEPEAEVQAPQRRMVSWNGAWEGIGRVSPAERLHQLLVVERTSDGYTAELYHFRFPKDALPIAIGEPQIHGDQIVVSLLEFPGRFEGRLDRSTGKLMGQWVWQERPLDGFELVSISRRDANRIRFPLGKPPGKKIKLKYQRPRKDEPGLAVGKLAEAGLQWAPIQRLFKAIAEGQLGRLHGILVASGGKLLLEQYFYGFESDDLHEIRSLQKSLIGMMILKLFEQGKIESLDDPIWKYLDASQAKGMDDTRKQKITVRHLLTMTSGLDARDYGSEPKMQAQPNPDWVAYMMNAPMAHAPGTVFEYHSSAMHMLVAVAEKAGGQRMQPLLAEAFLAPMGIEKFYFYHDPSGRLYGAGGGAMRPRDLLKLGLLVLNRGSFDGQRLLGETSVATMLQPAVDQLPWPEPDVHYASLWYVRDFTFGGERVRTYQARGAGVQNLVVIPAWDLVWVSTGGNYRDIASIGRTINAVTATLAEARGLKARPPARRSDQN